jgi:hypothetical protein
MDNFGYVGMRTINALLLLRVLGDIDPEYFHSGLPNVEGKAAENWIPRWQNCKRSLLHFVACSLLTISKGKFIEKEVSQFIRDECGKLPQLSRTMNADLKAIATNSSTHDILKVNMHIKGLQAPRTLVHNHLQHDRSLNVYFLRPCTPQNPTNAWLS